jgi:hypothetical protein
MIVERGRKCSIHKEKKLFEHNFNGLVQYLHSIGMALNFSDSWPSQAV